MKALHFDTDDPLDGRLSLRDRLIPTPDSVSVDDDADSNKLNEKLGRK